MIKKWWFWLGIFLILASCVGTAYAAYWFGSHEHIEKVSAVSQKPAIVEVTRIVEEQQPIIQETEEVAVEEQPEMEEEPQVVETESPKPEEAEVVDQELFVSPVKAEDTFNEESSWMIAEPGVILDNSTAWTIPATKDTWFQNVPEGAFSYYSLGQGKISVNDYSLVLPYKEGHNYLVLIRGRIDDGKVDTDRNLTAEVVDFVPGHAIWSHMPKGAYVSKDWFLDQLKASTTEGYTNCGALGCSKVTVVLLDVDSKTEQRFAVEADDLLDWKLL